jgi:translocation and assembly module TamA
MRNLNRTISGVLLMLVSSINFAAISGVSGPVLANVEKRLHELEIIKPLNQYDPQELQQQIINAIEPFAYFRARVAVHVNNQNKVDIIIHPGAPLRISALNVALMGPGSQSPKLQALIHDLPFKVGDPLNTDKYNKLKQHLVNTAENLGYLRSSFKKAEIILDVVNNRGQIHLVFDTGPEYFFGQVQFDPTYISPRLLHRFVPFKPGQAYSTEQILKLNKNLSDSGYFNSVLVNPQITDALTVPVNIKVLPVPKYSYSLGAGYGTDTGFRGRAGLHITPVNRKGHKFNAIAQGSTSQNALLAQYIIPAHNPVTDQYIISGNFSNLNYTSGDSNSVLVSLAHQHNVDRFKRSLSINSLYERFNYTLQPANDQFILYPKASLTFNRTSSKLFSPSGYSLTFNALGGTKAVLSDINIGQVSMDARAALMLEPLGLRLYGHTIQGITAINDINTLPISLALLLGGTDNLKGFSFNSIGPGKYTSYAGFEIQKEVVKNWYIMGFYDAGTVYNPTPQLTQYDAGGGLMWVSPIGPIKAGIAQPITDRFAFVNGSKPRLVISMGPDL